MTERALTAGQKTLIDLGPLVVFFAINYFYGIMIGCLLYTSDAADE